MQKRVGAAQHVSALIWPDRADERDLVVVDPRRDPLLEVVLILDDARDDEPPVRRERHVDRLRRTLVRMDAPEEQQIAARRIVEGERGGFDPVVDRGGIVEVGMAVGSADCDVGRGSVIAPVDLDDPGRREPMNRRHDRRVDEAAVGQRQEVETVVDDVELTGPLERVSDVEALGHLRFDRRILRVPPGNRCGKPTRGDRVSGGEQRHVDSSRNESLGQERGELFPRPVVTGGHAP